MAFGAPSRARSRRKNAPKALCEWCTLPAASRKATATRLAPGRTRRDSTFPPETLCCGHSPNQLQKCLTLGQRLIAVPISLRMTQAVSSSMPSRAVRSTPAIRESGVRTSKRGAFAFQDGLDNRHAGHPGDVAHHFGELEVHLLQGFLHMLDMLAGVGDEH